MRVIRRVAVGLLATLVVGVGAVSAASAETVPLPGGVSSASDQIDSTACPAAGDCVAVGNYVDSNSDTQSLIETESGGTWSAQAILPSALPGTGATQSSLRQVQCTSIGNCVAVGDYFEGSSDELPLIATETNGTWSVAEAPVTGLSLDSGDARLVLNKLSCAAAGNCLAAGTFDDHSGNAQGFLETESGGAWAASELPVPTGARANPEVDVNGISCSSVGHCAVVGDYADSAAHEQALLDSDALGAWSAVGANLTGLGASTNPGATLAAVSCPSDGNCSAVGFYEASSGAYAALAVNETSGGWGPATSPGLPSDASTTAPPTSLEPQEDLYLNAVSCASAGNCTAVGSYDSNSTLNNVEALTWTETNGVWASGVATSAPGDAASNPEAAFDSVLCSSATSCVAAGSYENTSGDNGALVARLASGTWSSAGVGQTTSYSSYGSDQIDVSCAVGGYCVVGGATMNVSYVYSALLLASPAAPVTPTAVASGTQATVSWSAPTDSGGLPVTGYTVTATDVTSAGRGGQVVSAGSSATSAAITGLTAGDTYTFSVSATSLVGSGLAATSASVLVPVPKPSTAVISTSLGALLVPHGAAAKLKKLRRTHSFVFSYHAVEAGVATVRWYRITGHGKHKHQTLVASGKATATGIGVFKLVVHLTAKGRRLVASSGHHLHLTAYVTFVGGGSTVERVHAFTLT